MKHKLMALSDIFYVSHALNRSVIRIIPSLNLLCQNLTDKFSRETACHLLLNMPASLETAPLTLEGQCVFE